MVVKRFSTRWDELFILEDGDGGVFDCAGPDVSMLAPLSKIPDSDPKCALALRPSLRQ
jgi:hypothetical protein